MGFEKPLEGGLAQPGGLCRGQGFVPQIEKPAGGTVLGNFKHLRVIPPQLLAHAIGQTTALLLQVVDHARPLTQLDDHRIIGRQDTERMAVGAQAVGQHPCIAPVIPRLREGGSWRRRR
jgi:hypothetical protein